MPSRGPVPTLRFRPAPHGAGLPESRWLHLRGCPSRALAFIEELADAARASGGGDAGRVMVPAVDLRVSGPR